jgi:hypothetical protein
LVSRASYDFWMYFWMYSMRRGAFARRALSRYSYGGFFKPPCFGQRQRQGAVALEALADRLRVPTQPTLTALAALLRQVRVERFPTVET